MVARRRMPFFQILFQSFSNLKRRLNRILEHFLAPFDHLPSPIRINLIIRLELLSSGHCGALRLISRFLRWLFIVREGCDDLLPICMSHSMY